MSVYRENALPAPETVFECFVSTRRGQGWVVFLLVIAIMLLVAAGVSIFAGAPPQIESWTWPMAAIGAVALIGTFFVNRRRRRVLQIVRTGDQHHLVIERENVRLEFPLAISGDQMTQHVRGIPIYEVWLKLVDRTRTGGVFVRETRGAIHGAQANWLQGLDRSGPAQGFESGRAGLAAELRAAVEAINVAAGDRAG